MAWSWVRPADPTLLEGRPLLDLGTGDGATIAGLPGLVVGLDRSEQILRAGAAATPVVAEALALPFGSQSFAVVVAGDLFHHLDDTSLERTMDEIRRVLRADGLLVAWWYERPSRPGPDAPAFPRPFGSVKAIATANGLAAEPLALEFSLEPAPATAGMVAKPG